MGATSSKLGSVSGFTENPERGASEPRRQSLLDRISNLLSRPRAARPSKAEPDTSKAELTAMRERMTPPKSDGEETSFAVRESRHAVAFVPHATRAVFDAQSRALQDFPLPRERVDPEWKPVMTSVKPMVAGASSLDELVEEAGGDPSAQRFPSDT